MLTLLTRFSFVARSDGKDHRTPIHGAVFNNLLPIVSLLAQHGADLNVKQAVHYIQPAL